MYVHVLQSHVATAICTRTQKTIIGRVGASRSAGAGFYMYTVCHPAMKLFWSPRAPVLRANINLARSHPVTW